MIFLLPPTGIKQQALLVKTLILPFFSFACHPFFSFIPRYYPRRPQNRASNVCVRPQRSDLFRWAEGGV